MVKIVAPPARDVPRLARYIYLRFSPSMKSHDSKGKQTSIVNFFTKRPSSSQSESTLIITPEKLTFKRSESVLSRTKDDGFDESFGNSDTSFDSPELNNFKNPVLERTLQSRKPSKKVLIDLTQSYNNTEQMVKKRDNSTLFDTLNSMKKKIKPNYTAPGMKSQKSKISSNVSLSKQQLLVISYVESNKNIFYTGSAGTGKSVVLREIVKRLQAKHGYNSVGVTASTGLAACNIGGQTLHRFLGIGLGVAEVHVLEKSIRSKPAMFRRWQMWKVLIIDEISMIDGKLFTKIEQLARVLRGNDAPFGGIQIVCTGDFFQLPPIAKNGVAQYCFETSIWDVVIEKTILLTEVFRQSGDSELIDMLNALRFGKMEKEMIEKFLQLQRPKVYDDGIEPTELFPTREEVKNANNKRLQAINATAKVYDAVDSVLYENDAKLLDNLMCEKRLVIKPNAQVMYLKNREDSIVNGSIGKVVFFCTETLFSPIRELYDDSFLYDNSILQEVMLLTNKIGKSDAFSDQETIIYNQIPPERKSKFDALLKEAKLVNSEVYPVVNFKDKYGDHAILVVPEEFTIDCGSNGKKREITRTQLPLLLSWAMSIHKSQGQTIQRLKVDLKRIFEDGQVYVALSRAVNKENLEIKNFDANKIRASDKVKHFYASLETYN